MLRWLESGPYWIIYYLVYLVALLWQGAVVYPTVAREEWAIVLTVAAGIALTATIVIELGVRAMLLIPKAIHDILERGRAEGRVEGREEERREILELLVKDNRISEEDRREIESKRK